MEKTLRNMTLKLRLQIWLVFSFVGIFFGAFRFTTSTERKAEQAEQVMVLTPGIR